MSKNNWTKEQTIVAFNVYCKIPFKKSSSKHPEIIKYAKIIGRSPSALNMKIGNFGRLDPELKRKGIVGLANGSKTEEIVWNEFNQNWDKLAFESEKIISEFEGKNISNFLDEKIPIGIDKMRLTKTRINQSFFRRAILSAYNSKCCITGLNLPELLIASHIIPWKENIERTNPRNGLCLNNLHDKAFDNGLISISPDYYVLVSKHLLECEKKMATNFFIKHNNKPINLPDRFLPKKEFLEKHYLAFQQNEYN